MLKLYRTYISIYICVLISITYVKMELAGQCYSNFLFDFSLCWLAIYLESAKDFKSLNLFFFIICQINSLHVILYYIYQPSLWFSSDPIYPLFCLFTCPNAISTVLLQTAQPELSFWYTHYCSYPFWSLPIKLLSSSILPPLPPVFCQIHLLQTMHHRKSH